MKDSKISTIFILIVILIYFLFSKFYLVPLGNTYTYIINPLFFLILSIILKFTILSPYKTNKYKKDIVQYIFITMLLYSLLYLLSGLLTGYGTNPYNTSVRGIVYNLYSMGLVVFLREYIRYKLINNVYKKDRSLICVLTVIVFSMQDIDISSVMNNVNEYYLFKSIFHIVVPSLIKNSLFTYIELYTDFIPAVCYELINYMLLWLSPILPKSPWVLEAIIDIIFPVILLLYCRYHIYSRNRFHLSRVSEPIEPSGMIPLGIGIVLVIWFALGIFPVRPIGIATKSMKPELGVGDMVLIQKCTPNDIKENDIIQYKRDKYTVVHRVIKKYQKDGEYFFITKGDNNKKEDMDPVREDQLLGKVIFKIKYIAYPTIWINNLSNVQVDIEIGE